VRTALVAGLILAAGLTGCLGSGSGGQPPSQGGPHIGTPLQLADCADWRRADPTERAGTVRQLRKFAGGPAGSPAGHGAVLKDDQAYELFERYCSNGFARHFRLYKLYTRAAAFGVRKRP
jgi:hypothetical protein